MLTKCSEYKPDCLTHQLEVGGLKKFGSGVSSRTTSRFSVEVIATFDKESRFRFVPPGNIDWEVWFNFFHRSGEKWLFCWK